jgi:hypothetical protein
LVWWSLKRQVDPHQDQKQYQDVNWPRLRWCAQYLQFTLRIKFVHSPNTLQASSLIPRWWCPRSNIPCSVDPPISSVSTSGVINLIVCLQSKYLDCYSDTKACSHWDLWYLRFRSEPSLHLLMKTVRIRSLHIFIKSVRIHIFGIIFWCWISLPMRFCRAPTVFNMICKAFQGCPLVLIHHFETASVAAWKNLGTGTLSMIKQTILLSYLCLWDSDNSLLPLNGFYQWAVWHIDQIEKVQIGYLIQIHLIIRAQWIAERLTIWALLEMPPF